MAEVLGVWKLYRKVAVAEMRPYIEGEDVSHVSFTDGVEPKVGGMIVRDPKNHDDQWYITAGFFAANYVEVTDG